MYFSSSLSFTATSRLHCPGDLPRAFFLPVFEDWSFSDTQVFLIPARITKQLDVFVLSAYTSIRNLDVTLQFCHSGARRFGRFVFLMTRCTGSTDSLLRDIMLPS